MCGRVWEGEECVVTVREKFFKGIVEKLQYGV